MRVPNFDDVQLTKFLVEWQREIDQARRESVSAVTANRALLLYSPSKKVYEIKVDDLGAITATLVAG